MKNRDLIRTFGTGLLAAALCLTMTTACTEENPAGDDTENNGGGGSAGGGTEDNGGGGLTGSDYYTSYTDDDLTYDEAAGVYVIRTERGLRVWGRGIYLGSPEVGAVLAADIELGNDMPDYYTENHNWGEEIDLRGDITFDGAGHTISGMRIEYDGRYHGLFRIVTGGAEVTNLTVEGSMRYTGDDESYRGGGIAGECDGGRIVNCTFRGTIDGGAVDGGSSRTALTMVGGIVGYAHNGSTIRNCTAEGTFTAGGSFSQVGGIVGQNSMQTLGQTVRDCYTTENCHVTGSMAGGIAGYLYGSSTELRDCSSGAEVTGPSRVGGIVGFLEGRGITGCHTTETCRVSSPVYAGGLVGWLSSGCLSGCYSLAEVTGTESESRTGYAGGLVGFGDNDEYIVGCYFAGTAQAPVKAGPFIGHQNYYVYQSAIYASGRVLIDGVEDPSLTNVYYTYMPSTSTEVSLTADGKLDWETTTTELNKHITAYNRDNVKKCEYHFVQTDGTSNPPALAEGEPGAN